MVDNRITKKWKLLFALLLINYQIITILCNDFVLLKFLRDIVLIMLIGDIWAKNGVRKPKGITIIFVVAFFAFLLNATVATSNISMSFTFLRKYIFPIAVFYTMLSWTSITNMEIIKIEKFILNFLFLFSLWGIFQAWILGDSFLIHLGYPVKYSGAYGRMALNDSFYFGNLGIQRVVSTISNSNVCALILGTCIIFFVIGAEEIISNRSGFAKLLVICFAYLLTFSRANFLAMMIVLLLIIWKYIPKMYRRYIKITILIGVLVCVSGYIIGDNPIYDIIGWIVNTLTGKEASSSHRVIIWMEALKKVIETPFGVGFGKVGSFAQNAKVVDFVHAENSYLAIALDTGWFGLAMYIGMLLSLKTKFSKFKKHVDRIIKMKKAACAITLYLMVCFCFSNHIYDMEAVTVIFFLIGLLIKKADIKWLNNAKGL